MGRLALSGPLSVDRVARHLGTSSRSLQRRLCERQLTFRSVAEEIRFDLARILLLQSDMAVQDIATRLGYRTPSSFSRAFTRWTGCSPRAFRARERAAGAAARRQ